MVRFIKHCFVFLSATITIYLIVFGIMFNIHIGNIPIIYRAIQGNVWKGGGTYIKTRQFNTHTMHDIVIVGSSHAYRGYDPRIFRKYGYETYNLGTSDQKIMCSYFIIKNYINHNNCKLVLLDLYDRVFSQSNIESYSDMIQNIPSDKAALEIACASKDIRAVNMLTLRLFNNSVKPLNHDTVGYINGYLPTNKQLKLPAKRRDYVYKTNKESLYYLEKILSYLKEEGVKVVMTQHSLPSVIPISDHKLFREDIISVLNKYNIEWFDYSTDRTLTDIQYFADESHLNITGVEKFNHRLINDLLNSNVLPPATKDTPFVYKYQ